MDTLEKMHLLCDDASVEAADDGCAHSHKSPLDGIVISHAILPNGRRIRILKTLLTSVCENDCRYCGLRSGRDTRRASLTPDEFAKLIIQLTRAGLIQGAFVSSGVAGGGIRTQDGIIAAAEILRKKMGYRGYLHLKIMPGAEFEQVQHSLSLADRVSINLEAPNMQRLAALAPHKDFWQQLWQPLMWMRTIRQSPAPDFFNRQSWPSVSTQFVVGGSGESDRELLSVSQTLFSNLDLRRIYYSALKPIKGTPLEHHPGIAFQREQRLYQASYLMRDYGFQWDEIPLDACGNLSLTHDPKTEWARINYLQSPLEINRASPHELLRVPGIGPVGMKAILRARKSHSLKDISMLSKLGIRSERASPYILLAGRHPASQPGLFV